VQRNPRAGIATWKPRGEAPRMNSTRRADEALSAQKDRLAAA
jgi:hypothetical protein